MLMFDEQEVYDIIKDTIQTAFKTSSWREIFGGKEMKFVDENFGEQPTFPVTYIGIMSQEQANGTYDSSEEEKFTWFEFEIECFNQETDDYTKQELGIMINKEIVEALKTEFNPHITQNQRINSPDESIYRRRIQGYSIYDNNNKIFYR